MSSELQLSINAQKWSAVTRGAMQRLIVPCTRRCGQLNGYLVFSSVCDMGKSFQEGKNDY